jgi:hypothetical protein
LKICLDCGVLVFDSPEVSQSDSHTA